MRRPAPHAAVAGGLVVALLAVGCGGDDAADTSSTITTTTTPLVTSTTTTTEAAAVADLEIAAEGDEGPVVRSLQFLLVCNGYTNVAVDGVEQEMVPDGMYGKITTAAVGQASRDLGMGGNGASVDAALYEDLTFGCDDTRSVYLPPTILEAEAGGYAAPDLPDIWTFSAQAGQRVVITPDEPPLSMGLSDPDGEVVVPVGATDSLSVELTLDGSYTVLVESQTPATYQVTVRMPPHHSAVILQSTGLDVVDFGAGPDKVIGLLTAVFGDPTLESAWFEANDQCIRWRRVSWGDDELSVYFTAASLDAAEQPTFAGEGVEHFAGWKLTAPASGGDPALPSLATPSGLLIGDDADRVEEIYADRVVIDGTDISIVDGAIIGELTATDGTVAWLSAGAAFCSG